jgi:hypothetical protein
VLQSSPRGALNHRSGAHLYSREGLSIKGATRDFSAEVESYAQAACKRLHGVIEAPALAVLVGVCE